MEQRFRSDKGIIIDIVPFGGLADAEGFISWPPDNDPKMCVTGFEDALRDCLQIKINDTQFVNVVSLPGLAMLKLLAWADRHYQSRKDAQYLELFLRVYGDMSKSSLFGSEVALMEKHNFDIDMAGPELLGQDIGKIASDETKLRLVRIMNSHEEEVRLNEILVEQVSIYLPGRDYRRTEAILGCVLSGLIRQRN
jgi:predicted nucleotidyltransferase